MANVSCTVLWFLLLSSQFPPPQNGILRGTVRDALSGAELEYVNVFLSNTLMGTSTGADGGFSIGSIPRGLYRVVASRVGYLPAVMTVEVRDSSAQNLDFRLQPRALVTDEVSVEAADPGVWKELLLKFLPAFIGQSKNAALCSVQNPEVVNLSREESTGRLQAWSDSMIVVDNHALGYRISAVLERFSWDTQNDIGEYGLYPRYAPLPSASPEEEAVRAERRERTYRGSMRHFFVTVVRGALDESPFLVFSGAENQIIHGFGNLMQPDELLLQADVLRGGLRLSFRGTFRIEYRKTIPPSVSYLKLTGDHARIDSVGNLLTPFSLLVGGAWARDRLADQLPLEWVPPP